MLTPEQIVELRMPGVTIPAGYYELAESMLSDCIPDGQDRNMMIALQTMHLYQVDQDRSAGASGSGIITSEKEGDLSVDYGSVNVVDSELGSTPWGVELSGYLQRFSVKLFTRFSDVC